MKVLVPLPFDISNLAHGRNLRVVHLLRRLNAMCSLTCLVGDEATAASARSALPGIRVTVAREGVEPAVLEGGSPLLQRAVAFFGGDGRLVTGMVEHAAQADTVLGFGLQSVACLLAAQSPSLSLHSRLPRTVLDLIDDPWLTWRSLPLPQRCGIAGIKSAICTQIVRKQVLSRFDALVAVAPRDACGLMRSTGTDVRVVANGVIAPDVLPETEREPLIVFTGAMDFPPNATAARFMVREVWPRVLRRIERASGRPPGPPSRKPTGEPPVRLAIVGRNPSRRILRLGSTWGVTVTGEVEEMGAWLRRARVAVAPMVTGSGIKNKILEALAVGCPVVATLLGAQGMPVGVENGILTGRSARSVSYGVWRLLAEPELAATMGRAGWELVRREFCWDKAARAMLSVVCGDMPTAGDPPGLAPAPDVLTADQEETAVSNSGREATPVHAPT